MLSNALSSNQLTESVEYINDILHMKNRALQAEYKDTLQLFQLNYSLLASRTSFWGENFNEIISTVVLN